MRYQPTNDTLSVIQRLGGVWSGRHAMVRCPAHEDRTPSLSIRQGRNSILVHCFAGCDGAAVMRGIRQVLGHTIPDQRATPEPANDREPPFRRLWAEARPVEGTLGERYLRDVRGIRFVPADEGGDGGPAPVVGSGEQDAVEPDLPIRQPAAELENQPTVASDAREMTSVDNKVDQRPETKAQAKVDDEASSAARGPGNLRDSLRSPRAHQARGDPLYVLASSDVCRRQA